MKTLRFALPLLALSPLALSGCSDLGAQEKASPEENRFADVEIKTEELAPGIAVLFGAGGNIGVSHGADGTVLIDDQFAPLSSKIESAIAAIDATPVKFLINTHWHGDHSGGNENFGKSGALIMAQDNVRIRLTGAQESGKGSDPASPSAALPVITYADGIKLHLNGDTVRVQHMPHGHTDGDSVVYWEKANVIHMGDLFFNKVTLPFIDIDSGGNAVGMLEGVEKALDMIGDDTKVIPGHGPMAAKADLVAYRDMLKTVITAVDTQRKAGKSLEQIQAMKPAAKYDVNPDGFITGDAFVEAVYRSLGARVK